MTLQQLQYIVALDDHRHYVTAAEHSFVSQPNLTMQVKKLEEEIGAKIFDRNRKPLKPTDIGKEVISRARQILREVKQLQEFVHHEIELVEGEYNIGIIPTLAPYILPQMLPVFTEENTKVHLRIHELQTSQIIAQVRSGIIDIGLLATPLNEPSIREIPIFYEPFLLYVPLDHPLNSHEDVLPINLESKDILVLDEGHCFRDQTLAICNKVRDTSQLGFEYSSGSIEALKNLVKNGIGYTLVPELSVMHELNSGYVKRFTSPQPVREISLVVHSNFIKTEVVNRLKSAILKTTPKRFLEKQTVVKITND